MQTALYYVGAGARGDPPLAFSQAAPKRIRRSALIILHSVRRLRSNLPEPEFAREGRGRSPDSLSARRRLLHRLRPVYRNLPGIRPRCHSRAVHSRADTDGPPRAVRSSCSASGRFGCSAMSALDLDALRAAHADLNVQVSFSPTSDPDSHEVRMRVSGEHARTSNNPSGG